MTKYYVSRHLSSQLTSIYIQGEDSWSAIGPDDETSTIAGAIPARLLERAQAIDPSEATRLIEQRRAAAARRLEAQRREQREWLPGRSARVKVLVIVGLLVFCGILAFAVGWVMHVSDPTHKYDQVHLGMTYEEVAHILSGLDGPHSGDSIRDGTYRWLTRDRMVWIDITFRDSRVVGRDITNWEI